MEFPGICPWKFPGIGCEIVGLTSTVLSSAHYTGQFSKPILGVIKWFWNWNLV